MDPFLARFLDPTEELVIEKVSEFSLKYLTEEASREIEKVDEIPYAISKAAREAGLFGIRVPEEFGGSELGLLPSLMIHETISSFSLAVGVYLDQTLFVEPVRRFGTNEQKAKFLGRVANEGVPTTSAMTEPTAGSDVLGIAATAKKEGSNWRINGTKTFITMGDQAQCFILFAKTSQGRDKDSITAFLVEKGKQGLRIGEKIGKIGQMGTHINEIFMEDIILDEGDVLGKAGQGYDIAMFSYEYGRLTVAAQALGLAEGMLRKSVRFSLDRKAFGQQINRFQLLKDYIARMDVAVETARSIVYRSAMYENDPSFSELSSISKLYATEISSEVSRLAVRLHGGLGVTKEMGIERGLRDAIIQEIYEGTNEVQKLIIAKYATERYKG